MRRLVLLAGLACLTAVAEEAKPSDPGASPTVTLDATRTLGPVRRLNGMNNTVPLVQTDFPEMILSNAFARLRIPYTRFHDAALENPGYELIDVSRDRFSVSGAVPLMSLPNSTSARRTTATVAMSAGSRLSGGMMMRA